jgi:hypothetical protein
MRIRLAPVEPKEWHLADAPLRTELAADHAHVFFLDGGAFYFMIRVVDETLHDRGSEPVWRVMGNRPEPLSQLIRFLRAFVFPPAVKLPFVRGLMVRTVSGLDHELPNFLPTVRAGRGLETVEAG